MWFCLIQEPIPRGSCLERKAALTALPGSLEVTVALEFERLCIARFQDRFLGSDTASTLRIHCSSVFYLPVGCLRATSGSLLFCGFSRHLFHGGED